MKAAWIIIVVQTELLLVAVRQIVADSRTQTVPLSRTNQGSDDDDGVVDGVVVRVVVVLLWCFDFVV